MFNEIKQEAEPRMQKSVAALQTEVKQVKNWACPSKPAGPCYRILLWYRDPLKSGGKY